TDQFIIASRKATTPVIFYQGGSTSPYERLRLDTSGNIIISGNVGIGTTSPVMNLDVNGGAVFRGTPFAPSGVGLEVGFSGDAGYVQAYNRGTSAGKQLFLNYAIGKVWIGGDAHIAGTLSKGGGSFLIDHPLDPENKILQHSFVESPDMMNIYNGNIVTDERGLFVVHLPDYFEALNKDFKYQLTVIGDFAQAIIAEEIKDNQFTIKTDKPNIKVSWQVTGIRHDAFALEHPIIVEQEKGTNNDYVKGRSVYPDENVSEALGILPAEVPELENSSA
ncbi:MAG: hypothetical protein KKB79_02385, partial [Nanoarchaeota archaeon]|nr:hypothetical protein [Nanoarchaeota archaeon]